MMFIMAQNALIGTEQEFIDQFIEMLTSKSQGKIVCKSADYHMDDSTPSFTLTVHDTYQVTFARNGNKNSACNDYYVRSNYASSKLIQFGSNEYYSSSKLRVWQFNIIGNDNAMLLEFGSQLTAMETLPEVSFVSVREGGIKAVMAQIRSNSSQDFPVQPYIYVTDSSYAISETNYLKARTDMIYDSTKPKEIKIADNKHMYSSPGNQFQRDIFSLKDCMYVPARRSFKTVDGREYFCVCQGSTGSSPRASTILEVI